MIQEIMTGYLRHFQDEAADKQLLLDQVNAAENLQSRKNFRGHITSGGLVLNPDKTKLLLIHHRVLNLWVQPGGHWDEGDATPLVAGEREVIEETGVRVSEYLPFDAEYPLVPLDIDTHYIPANPSKNEAEHYHHDFRYVFLAGSEDLTYQKNEVYDAKWFALKELTTQQLGASLVKLYQFMKAEA